MQRISTQEILSEPALLDKTLTKLLDVGLLQRARNTTFDVLLCLPNGLETDKATPTSRGVLFTQGIIFGWSWRPEAVEEEGREL
jgi:hypothetical protein